MNKEYYKDASLPDEEDKEYYRNLENTTAQWKNPMAKREPDNKYVSKIEHYSKI